MNRFLPRYGVLGVERLEQRGREAKAILYSCTLCPRLYRVNRLAGELGFYGMGSLARCPYSGNLYSDAPDYASRTRVAVLAMQRQVRDLAVDAQGVAYRGLLVKHLLMPGSEGTWP